MHDMRNMLICNKLKMGGGKGPWKVKVLLALLTWTVLSTLFINLDSPLHYPYYHLDSAWYFICGKAWADGLVPYVDFTDSKGPLLWWIYGIGSMISPRDYVGVWILSCFYYTAVLYLCFLISMLLTKGDKNGRSSRRRLLLSHACVGLMLRFMPSIGASCRWHICCM